MRLWDIISEARVPPVRDQILADVKRTGGSPSEYFVRFTDQDRLGFSARQRFSHTPDVDDPEFDVDQIGRRQGRRALWFYPLATYLKADQETYAADSPYVWLVRLRDDAWLQPVRRGDRAVKAAPAGKQRVGMLRYSTPPAAIFFEPAYDVIGRYYDFGAQHQRHGQVKGPPPPTWFDRIRGNL